jgi:hypothetical protein
MADKNWGIKIYCECGAKYYSMNKKDKITCPICLAEYVPEDLNLRQAVVAPKPEIKKKLDDLDNVDDHLEDDSDDIISLDDQKDIEDSNEDIKQD